MSRYFDDLNPDQATAAACMGHCLTVAAPGSGKTKMLSAKAAFLLSEGHRVCAVTFTRDSAIELRHRIVQQAGDNCLPRLLVGTFHSIDLLMAFPSRVKSSMGKEILKDSRSSLRAPWVIVKEGTRRGAVKRAIEESKLLDLDDGQATALIESFKSGHQKPKTEQEQALVNAYVEIIERHASIDFQDILIKTNQGLASGDITPLKTDYLLLDEFQDTDVLQFDWMMHHAKAGVVVTAVGDDDQSIYGFRRALGFAGMERFANELQARRVVLGLNYRSHKEILKPASNLIAVNLDRTDKLLVSNKGPGGTTAWERFANRKLEAQACLEQIAVAFGAQRTSAVLARTNKRLDEVESQLIAARIPYERAGGDSILKSREMAVVVATLSCLVRNDAKDADDMLAWCGVDEQDLSALHKTFGKGLFLGQIGRVDLGKAGIKDTTKTLLNKLNKRFSEWRTLLSIDGVNLVLQQTVPLLQEYTVDKRSQAFLTVIGEVFVQHGSKNRAVTNDPKHDFVSRLDDIRQRMAQPFEAAEKSGPKVSLLTAHGSKGLEFDCVWVVGCEEGYFPDVANHQEERRLFYVAMTRAKQSLWLSAAGKPDVSRFIVEAGVQRVAEGVFTTA